MAKEATIMFDGSEVLLTVLCTTEAEAEDVAALIGKMGVTDVQTTTAPVMSSNGNNSGTKMKDMVRGEIVSWMIANG